MMDYLIKSGFCLVILLAVYHLFLEKEKMHRFKRLFLLFSLAFGLLISLITTRFVSNPIPPIEFSKVQEMTQPVSLSGDVKVNQNITSDTSPYTAPIIFIIYVAGVILLSVRFIANLIKIASKVICHTKIRSAQGTFVLLKENVVPHSFLNYIFLNEDAYLSKKIEKEVILHELTHVNQQHSIDLLVVEILKIIFWFNPVFILYKKAVQLNHEFLADQSVLVSYRDVSAYQSLLLQSASLKTVNLTSSLNYSLTIKQLKMMKKHTSKRIAMFKGIALLPLLILLVFLFSNRVIAQSEQGTKKNVPVKQGSIAKDNHFQGFNFAYKNRAGEIIEKRYKDLTADEKRKLAPSKSLIDTWKDPVKYRIGIDETQVQNEALNNYKTTDFVAFSVYKPKNKTRSIVNLHTIKYIESFKPGTNVKIKGNYVKIMGFPVNTIDD